MILGKLVGHFGRRVCGPSALIHYDWHRADYACEPTIIMIILRNPATYLGAHG